MSRYYTARKPFFQGSRRMKSKEMAETANKKHKIVYKSIVEGRAVLRITADKVFYNPVQEFNRDLSIAVLSVFVEDYKKQKLIEAAKANRGIPADNKSDMEVDKPVDITILEALSATGLRSIRYAKELVDVTKVIANDISENAVKTIKENIAFNNVDHIVETSHADACLLMYQHKARQKRFAAVDLDPYGSPAIFLDSAVQSVADGGLLLVTATDMAVLAGNSPETCYTKYGAIGLRTKCCHEMALRILLQCIESHANRYSRYIVPMLSVSADFYIRVFVKVYSGAGECKNTTQKLSMAYRCVGCDSITLHPLGGSKEDAKSKKMKRVLPDGPPVPKQCENCNHGHQMGGPVWSAPLHDQSFVSRVLGLVQQDPSRFHTARRLEGVLAVVTEELPDVPLYYTLDRLCGTVHSEMMPILVFRSALLNANFKVSYSHANKLSIKTNAPNSFVWDIMRKWVTFQPVKAERIEQNPVAKNILAKEITSTVDLTERDDANPSSRRDKQTRFPFNPAPFWGPGCRSTINTAEIKNMKAKRNQNKNKARWSRNPKRQRSPAEDEESSNKRPPQPLLINTTSEPDSDTASEVVELENNAGITAITKDIGNTNGNDVGTIEPGLNAGNTNGNEILTSETQNVDNGNSNGNNVGSIDPGQDVTNTNENNVGTTEAKLDNDNTQGTDVKSETPTDCKQ